MTIRNWRSLLVVMPLWIGTTACASVSSPGPTEATLRAVAEEACVSPAFRIRESLTGLGSITPRKLTVGAIEINPGYLGQLTPDAATVDVWPVTVRYHVRYAPARGVVLGGTGAPPLAGPPDADYDAACWFYRRADGGWSATQSQPRDARPLTTKLREWIVGGR